MYSCHVPARLLASRNVRGIVWLQSYLKYVGPEGETTYYVTPADAFARVSVDSRLRRAAIRLDSMLGSWL